MLDVAGVGISATIISAVVTLAIGLLTRRSEKEELLSAQWQAYVDDIQSWTQRQLEERDRLDAISKERTEERITDLEAQVTQLSETVDLLKSKYRVAISHIREWRSMHPDLQPEPPAEIREDVGVTH